MQVGTHAEQEQNGCGAAKDIDIWFFQEVSMNRVAMEYRRNTPCEGAMWIYNDSNVCENAIMRSRSMVNSFSVDKVIGMKHGLIVKGGDRETKMIMVNLHLPTSWQTIKEFHDAVEAISEDIQKSVGTEKESYAIMAGGDFNTSLWARSRDDEPWQENLEERAQILWEWIHTWSLRCKPLRNEQTEDDIWSYMSNKGNKKRMDYVLFNRDFDDVGSVAEWHSRSDHRPVLAELGRQDGQVIRFSPHAHEHHARMGAHPGGSQPPAAHLGQLGAQVGRRSAERARKRCRT